MAEQQNLQPDGLDEVTEALSKTEQVIEKHQKTIFIALFAAIVIVSGLLAVRHFYYVPKEAKAHHELFKGESYFGEGEYQIALDGNQGDYIGLEAIINKSGSTKAGNLAKAYAGIAYMQLGEYEKAIQHLNSFSAKDLLISPAIVGAVGDCYVELGKVKEGISYFEKAASQANNELIAPIYLKKAGNAYLSLNDFKSALIAFEKIKNNYPTSTDANDIEKYIERAKNQK